MLKFNITHPKTTRTIKLTVYTSEQLNAARFLETWHLPINWLLTSDASTALERITDNYPFYSGDCLYLGGTVAEDGRYLSAYKEDMPLEPLAKIETDTNETVYCYHYDIIAVFPSGKLEQAKIARID